MNKKVLCFTLYNSMNYGAFLQAFSIKEVLEKKYNKDVYFYKIPNKINFKGKSLKNKLFKIVFILKNHRYIKKMKIINNKDGIDISILGSDEIWNVKNPTFEHKNEFFGKGLNSNKIVSLAASCNNSNISDITRLYGQNVFNNVDYISVRDSNTKNLFSKSNKKIYELLDPTFSVNWEEYVKFKKKKENYILVYGYHFTDKEIELIKKFSYQKNIKVYSIGIYQKSFKNICCSSFEFINYVKNCDYMITKSFHGTIFSILMKKKFIVFKEKDNLKIEDLLLKLNLQDRIIEREIDKIEKSIDYKKIQKILEKKKKEYFDFIDKWV